LAADIAIVPATAEHAAAMAPRMREADRQEVWATSMSTPLDALERSLARSRRAHAGLADGVVVCLFGVAPVTVMGDVGMPWLLGSEELPRYAVPFLRRNRPYVAAMSRDYRVLTNYVDARNALSIRWLRWLGFAIMSTEPYGALKLPFHRFEMRQG